MATLDILSKGRVDVGLGRTGYPYQLTPYGSGLEDTRGMWEEFAEVLPKAWAKGVTSHEGKYFKIPPREVLPKPLQKPHPPLWSACGSDETVRLAAEMGLGALVGSEGGPEKVGNMLELYRKTAKAADPAGMVNNQTALMTAGFCHEDPRSSGPGASSWWLGTWSSNGSGPAWSGKAWTRPPFPLITRAITRGTCGWRLARTRAKTRPKRW